MTTLSDDTRIAGEKTVADWAAMKDRLTSSPGQSAWTEAFKDFFKMRLESRYFEPIRAIEAIGKNAGEGFAIVALHCSLIEFLAATLKGMIYVHGLNQQEPCINKYSNSSDIFVEFLESNEPFKSMFSNIDHADEFYRSVRCDLLHEARTKECWKIRVCESATQAIDVENKVVYRNKMQAAFNQFVDCYGQQLLMDPELQKAFIRKFDSLCEE
jgi:hypothetical protein